MNVIDSAKIFAHKLEEKAHTVAGPLARKMGPVAEKAAPLAERAGHLAAKGVGTTAARVDRATSGKYHDKIDNASAKLTELFERAAEAAGKRAGNA